MFLLNQTYQERCGTAILSSGREINKFKHSTPKVIPMDTKISHSPTSQVFSKYIKLCSMKMYLTCLRNGIVQCLSISVPICTFQF